VCFFVFGSSGQDDPYITFSAAKFLAEEHHIANINGEAVEQGSSVLHVVILGVSHALTGISLSALGMFYSLLFGALCFPLTYILALQLSIRLKVIPLALLSVSTAFTYWSMGSLESTLTAFVVLLLINTAINYLQHNQRYLPLLISLCALLLCRPEAFFVVLLFIGLIALLWPNADTPYIKLLRMLIAAGTIFALLALWRLEVFSQAFPQPVYAKAGGLDPHKILSGLLYFIISAQLSLIVYSLMFIKPLYARLKNRAENNPALTIVSSFVIAYLGFIVASGGDWMGGGRFFVPIMPLLILGCCYYLQKSVHYKRYYYGLFMLAAFDIAVFTELQSLGMPIHKIDDFQSQLHDAPDFAKYSWVETSNYIHTNDIVLLEALTPIIDSALLNNSKVTLSGVQMGMIPYFLREEFNDKIYFVDMRGLITKHVTNCADFANAQHLLTGLFVDYPHYFATQQKGLCQLPAIDILFELENLNPKDNAARLKSLKDNNYHIVYRQHTNIKAGFFGKKVLNIPYFIAVSDDVFTTLPTKLRYKERTFSNQANLFITPLKE
jgi:hypothetical protein